MSYFSDTFGPLRNADTDRLTIAQMPDGSLPAIRGARAAADQRAAMDTRSERSIAFAACRRAMVGKSRAACDASDAWLTDGLSRYAEAMYAEQSDGVAGLHKALEDFAVGALMYEDTTPISQAEHLQPYSDQYRSIVADKGAMVFHMLRTELGDDAFTALLHDFYKQHDGKTRDDRRFRETGGDESAAAGEGPAARQSAFLLLAVAEFHGRAGIHDRVHRLPHAARDFKVVGKIHQDLDTFRMPVEMRVDTEGNPETKKILVTGTTSPFRDGYVRPAEAERNHHRSEQQPAEIEPAAARARAVARGEGSGRKSANITRRFRNIRRRWTCSRTIRSRISGWARRCSTRRIIRRRRMRFARRWAAISDPKWMEVWSHIYIGKIYDLLGQRERAVNEYSLAQHTSDDTAGAQQEAARYIQKPYSGDDSTPAGGAAASAAPTAPASAPGTSAPAADPSKPTLKRPSPGTP